MRDAIILARWMALTEFSVLPGWLESQEGVPSVAKALITGITGFAGGHLAAHLLARGDVEVYGVAHAMGYGVGHLERPVPVEIAENPV